VVPLPTFPILRAGESHYREKTKFPKLAETSSFLRIRSYPASFLSESETPDYKRNGSSVGVRSFVKLPLPAPRPPGDKSGSTDPAGR